MSRSSNSITVVITFIISFLLAGCLSNSTTTQIEPARPTSDSVVIVYTGKYDSTLMLSLRILNQDKFQGVAHSEIRQSASISNSCDTISHGVCYPKHISSYYSGIIGVVYMSDSEIWRDFSQIHSWSNDCGHVYVKAYYGGGFSDDYMYLNEFDSIIRSTRLSDSSLAVYKKFIADIRYQDGIEPLRCI